MTPSEVENAACELCLLTVDLLKPEGSVKYHFDAAGLTRFAELIERAAMEKAAKIADNACAYMQTLLPDAEDHIDRSMTIARISELVSIAADIRAAAQKEA